MRVSSCVSCGAPLRITDTTKEIKCEYCGVSMAVMSNQGSPTVKLDDKPSLLSSKSQLLAFLLCLFLGLYGGHRYYVGKWKSGVVMMMTLGGFTVWWVIDLIIILSGRFEDANGQRLADLDLPARQKIAIGVVTFIFIVILFRTLFGGAAA